MTRPHRLCQLSNPARVLRPLVLLRDPTLASPHRSRAPSHRLRIPRPRDLRSNQRHAHVVHLVRVVPRRLRKPLAQFRPHASHRQHSRRRGFERHRPHRPTRSILLPRRVLTSRRRASALTRRRIRRPRHLGTSRKSLESNLSRRRDARSPRERTRTRGSGGAHRRAVASTPSRVRLASIDRPRVADSRAASFRRLARRFARLFPGVSSVVRHAHPHVMDACTRRTHKTVTGVGFRV